MKNFNKIFALFVLLICFGGKAFAQTGSENGIELYQQGEYEKAIAALEKAVETDKKNQQSWLYLGMSLARLRKDGKATKAFRKAQKYAKKEKDADEANNNSTEIVFKSKPHPSYTDAARQNLVQGTISVAVEFGADGKIKNAFAFNTLPEGLTETALKAVAKIKFEPATKDGKPVSVIKIIEYSYSIY